MPRKSLVLLMAVMAVSVALWAQSPVSRVYVIGTGGTISVTGGTDAGSGRRLSAAELVLLLPALEDVVEIEVEDFSSISSLSMTPDLQFQLAMRVEEVLRNREDLAGIVVTHGTDTLEETAYMMDLIHDDPRPVVFTAALRPPWLSDSDGPRNLEGAVRTAMEPRATGKGVLVTLNDEIHSARYVTKGHSVALDAFQSGPKGIVGVVDEETVVFYSQPTNRVHIPTRQVETAVDMVRLVSGDEGKFIRHSTDTGARGLVVEAFGRGDMPRAVIDAIADAIDRGQTVVVVSRTAEGRVELPVRAREAGLIEGEDLDGFKARVLLMLALGADLEDNEIQELFRLAGGR